VRTGCLTQSNLSCQSAQFHHTNQNFENSQLGSRRSLFARAVQTVCRVNFMSSPTTIDSVYTRISNGQKVPSTANTRKEHSDSHILASRVRALNQCPESG
jgi:hypothetical protein